MREVWREKDTLRKGSPCASKVFPTPYPFSTLPAKEAVESCEKQI